MTPLKRQLHGTTILTRDPVTIGTAILGPTLTAATTVGGYALGAAIVGYVVTTAVTSFIMAALAPKPEIPESQGLLVNVRDGVAPHEFVYGQVRKGGTITYVETTGDKNKFLHQMIVIAGHEVEEIGAIYVNDGVVSTTDDTGYKPNGTDVATAGPGWVTTTKWTKKGVTRDASNPYRGQEIRWPRMRLLKHDGSQTAVTDAFAGSSTTTLSNTFLTETDNFDGTGQPTSTSFVGNDIAYLYARLSFDEKVFANGVPLITAVVKGKKVYDPRTGTTAYSNNAALVIRDYLTSAYGLSDDQIDDTYFSAAANICDENVALDGGGTEKRYTINGVIRASTSHQEVLTKMMSACGGTLFWGGGKWKLIVGDYVAPTKTLTLDDLRGPITLDTKLNLRDQFNRVQGTFNSAVDDWITTDYPAITSAAFLAQDGGQEAPLDLPLPFTTSSASAQRLAKQTLFRAREQMTLSADFGLNALDVEVGEIISLDIDRYGWSGKEFEVVGWALRPNQQAGDLRVSLTLRETSEAAFDWNAEESEIIGNDTTLPDFSVVPTVTGLTVSVRTSIQADGTTVTTALVSWDAAGDPVEYYEVLYKPLTTEVAAGSFVIGDEYQIKTVGTTDFTAIGAASNTVGLFFRATGVGSGTGVSYDAENNFSVVTTNSGDDLIASGTISVEIGPLIGGTLYYVKVRAIDSFGNIAEDFATTTFTASADTTVPNAPTNVIATGYFQSAVISWTPPTQNTDGSDFKDLKQYNIYRSLANNFASATVVGSSQTPSFKDVGLDDNTVYYYWVTAEDFTGNESVPSTSNDATTNFLSAAQMVEDIREEIGAARIDVVSSLPSGTGYSVGDFVFLTSDKKLYEWNGSSWVAAVGDIPTGSITSTEIANDAITTPKLATNSVTTDSLAANSVTTGKIAAGAVSADKIAVADLAAITANLGEVTAGSINTLSSGVGMQINVAAKPRAIYVYQDSTSIYGLFGENISTGGGVAQLKSVGGFTLDCVNTRSVSGSIALVGNNTTGGTGYVGLPSGDGNYAFDAISGGYYDTSGGGYNPFTGRHDGMISKLATYELGDIVVDGPIIVRDLTDSFTEFEVSSSANQKGAVGVLAKVHPHWHTPASFVDQAATEAAQAAHVSTPDNPAGPVITHTNVSDYEDDYDLVNVNSVGEGGINVCGECGNISKGDLIVTSSTPGKGMKQADDIVRSYTVAKAREDVTFSDPTEVKMVACIYLCG